MRLILITWTTMMLGFLVGPQANGQSFNIDCDVFFGGPKLGAGAPSDAFGAAADQPGRWNRVSGTGPLPLDGLNGLPTGVTYRAFFDSNAGSGGYNNQSNTGDYALLLNDARQVAPIVPGGSMTFRFSGLATGLYDIYTYAVHPAGVFIEVPVTIANATANQTQVVTGPMPGNSFAYLVTHSRHRVALSAGEDIDVYIFQPPNQQHGYSVNGFQIVAVPEPGTWVAIAAFSALMLRRRISQSKEKENEDHIKDSADGCDHQHFNLR